MPGEHAPFAAGRDLHVAADLDPGIVEDRLQRVAREQRRIIDAARVSHDSRFARDRSAHLRVQALATSSELEPHGVGAALGRLHGPLDIDEAGRVEPNGGGGPDLGRTHREGHGVLVQRDGAHRCAKGGPLAGLLLEAWRRGLGIEELLVDHDIAVDLTNPGRLELLDQREQIRGRERRVTVTAEHQIPRDGAPFGRTEKRGLEAVIPMESR